MFRTFLAEHSLYDFDYTAKQFPTMADRNLWESPAFDEQVKQAEASMDYGWPIIKATDFMEFKKSGNRKIMEDIHFERRDMLNCFALAELREGKGRFLPPLVNGLFAICEESYWGLSAHWLKKEMYLGNIPTPAEPYIDLFAAETASQLAMIAHMLKEPLLAFCPEIVERITYELERRIKEPYITHVDFWWMGYGVKRPNNWNPWILSNLSTVYLLTEPNKQRLCRALHKMLNEVQHYYDHLPADGGCDEGPGYWGHSGGALFDFLYQWKVASGGAMDFFGDEKIKNIATYMKKVHVAGDFFANFSDAAASGYGGMMPILFGYAKETEQQELANFSAAIYKLASPRPAVYDKNLRRALLNVQFAGEIEQYECHYPLHGTLEFLPHLCQAVIRKGEMTLVGRGSANDAGNNDSHNHNDIGSFMFYDGTTPVFIDVGIGVYTRFTFDNKYRYTMIPWTRSLYHNLPEINGAEQPYGIEYCADRFEADEEKIEISYAGAYPKAAGVKALTRTLTLWENGMRCVDRFAFEKENESAVKEALMCVLPVRVENGEAVIGEHYRVRAEGGKISTEFVSFEGDAKLEKNWGTTGVTRILVSTDRAKEISITVEKM